jgi:hypothetical protein
MSNDLVIVCDACRTPIADGEGYLHVDHAAIVAYRTARAGEDTALNPAAILAMPDVARWHAHHTRCYPIGDSVDYDVPVHEVRTWAELTATTARLMAKTWLPSTDWAPLLDDVTYGRGRVRAATERTRP